MDLLEFTKIYVKNLIKIGLVAGLTAFLLLSIFGPAPRGDMAHSFQILFKILISILIMFAAATTYTLYKREEYVD